MIPAQPSTEFNPETKLRHSAKGKSLGKVLKCTINPQEPIVEVENKVDEQVGPTEGADLIRVVKEEEDPDATDYSSSFDGTLSGAENCSGFSDAEVESGFYADDNLGFDDFNMFPTRKKKLTPHWKNYVRQLMWRCKWAELKVKEFQSQASKYDRELATYDQRRQLQLDQFTLENFGAKSLPFTSQNHAKKAMKRRKRKRVEDTTDIASFMSQHHLFSYRENKKIEPDVTLVADNSVNPEQSAPDDNEFGIIDDYPLLEPKDTDESLDEIVRKIETMQSHVQKLKSRLLVVTAENSVKFSSSEDDLSHFVPCDIQTSSARSPTFSACNGDTPSLGALYAPIHYMSEYDIGDCVVSSCGVSVPDIIESTVHLLSSVDVTMHQPQIGDTCEAIMDNVHIHNQSAEVEIYTPMAMHDPPAEKRQEPEGSGQSGDPSLTLPSDPNPVTKVATHQDQSRLTSCLASEINFPKSKRTRGERKAGSGGWNK